MDTEAIAAELRALRRGRGVDSADLGRRIGPHLREVVAVFEPAPAATTRQALTAALITCADRLPADLRTAIIASLGLSAVTRNLAHFADRMQWLSAELSCGYRTALRRVEAAERLVAEEIGAELSRRHGRPAGGTDWYLEELSTILRLDGPTPESYEDRRVVATRDGLNEVVTWLDLPPDPARARSEVLVDVLYGGRLVRAEQPTPHRFHFVVRLPVTLRAGQSHEYGLVLRIPPGQAMRPHYIYTPECPCKSFVLRVRFDPHQLPRWIRRVEGETVRIFDAARPTRDLVEPDAAGEVQVDFTNPSMYLGYGLQWLP